MSGKGPFPFRTSSAGAAILLALEQVMNEQETPRISEGEQLLSLVSHEIKNPLTSIAGFVSFAEDAVRNNDPELALQSLEIVRAEASRILRLAEDLLDASCVRAGKFSITPADVDLSALVTRVTDQYAAISGHKVEVCVQSGFPVIYGDPLRLTQVVENLISNAVKYCGDDEPIRVALESEHGTVRIVISNGGMTIPSVKLATLFHPFTRLTEKGTGLGLFISRQIVEAHGGRIFVSSQDRVGTTFTVELPARPEFARDAN